MKHNFLSTPVLLRHENKYYGSVDMADVVSYLVNKFSKEELKGSEGFWKQMDAAQAFGNVTVGEVMGKIQK